MKKEKPHRRLIAIILIGLLSLSFLGAITARSPSINKNEALDKIPYLRSVKDKISFFHLELTLHRDQSTSTKTIIRKMILSKNMTNETVIVPLNLDRTKSYTDFEIYDGMNRETQFVEKEDILAPPNCRKTFTFNREWQELRFCVPISLNDEVYYEVNYKTLPIQQERPSPNNIFANLSYELPEGEYDAEIILKADSNMEWDNSMETYCPDNSSFKPIDNGIMCIGHIKIVHPDNKTLVLDTYLKGADKEYLNIRREIKNILFFGTLSAFIAYILWSLVYGGYKKLRMFKRQSKKAPPYIG